MVLPVRFFHELYDWKLASGHCRHALDILDGMGKFAEYGPHYSRQTPGSRSFTGVGKEIVLVTDTALWSVVYQMTPRGGHWVFRNNVFRNLGPAISSMLIRTAVSETYRQWMIRYGNLPGERLRTENRVGACSKH